MCCKQYNKEVLLSMILPMYQTLQIGLARLSPATSQIL